MPPTAQKHYTGWQVRKPDLVTTDEAAAIAGITSSTFRTLASVRGAQSPPPAPLFSGRPNLYRRRDIERWAERRAHGAGRPTKRSA